MTALVAALAGVLAAAGMVDLAQARPRRRRTTPAALLIALGRRVGAAEAPTNLSRRLEAAGTAMKEPEATALKSGGAVAGALLGALLAVGAPGRLGLAIAPAGAAAGFIALDLALHLRARARASQIAIELPDVVDLLRVALEAGLPPTRALAEVGRRHDGVLAAELARAAARIAVGVSHRDALAELERRAPGTSPMTTILDRADRLGAPPAEALHALARDAREARARARAEAAAKAAPKIQLVVALLLVPSVMLLIGAALAPALLHAL